MYYIGLDIHKKTISYCVKDASGQIHREGKIGSTRSELDSWIKTLPQPRMIAMEATIFTGWIYYHLLPHAEKVKVANPLMLRPDLCWQDRRLPALRFPAGVLYGFHRHQEPA
jgi:transposase